MDQVSNRSGVGSDDITDESTSMVDARWSSDDDEVKKKKKNYTAPHTQHQVTAACTCHLEEWIHHIIHSDHAVPVELIRHYEMDCPLVGRIHYTMFHLTQVGFPL